MFNKQLHKKIDALTRTVEFQLEKAEKDRLQNKNDLIRLVTDMKKGELTTQSVSTLANQNLNWKDLGLPIKKNA